MAERVIYTSSHVADVFVPKENDYWYRKANTCYNNRDFADAIEFYSLSIKENACVADCYYNRGNAYREMFMQAEEKKAAADPTWLKFALSDLETATILNPKDSAAFTKRGITYSLFRGERDLRRAIECFSKALGLESDCTEAFVKRGNCHRE